MNVLQSYIAGSQVFRINKALYYNLLRMLVVPKIGQNSARVVLGIRHLLISKFLHVACHKYLKSSAFIPSRLTYCGSIMTSFALSKGRHFDLVHFYTKPDRIQNTSFGDCFTLAIFSVTVRLQLWALWLFLLRLQH